MPLSWHAYKLLQDKQISGKKKSIKINFLGSETTWLGAGLPREGVAAEKFVPSLESLSSLGFEESLRGVWDVPGILLGCPGPLVVFKKLVQKNNSCSFPKIPWPFLGYS